MTTLSDDYEIINGKPVLKDGHSVRVPMLMMDSLQKAVARNRVRDKDIECPDCDGEGKVNGRKCKRCDGEGTIDEDDLEPEEQNDAAAYRHGMRMAKVNPALHRPGFVFNNDSAAIDRKRAAYQEYNREIQDAWRHDAVELVGAREGDVCTVRGPLYEEDEGAPGHLKKIDGQLVCVPDKPSKKASNKDAREAAYRDHEAWLRDAWRADR